MRINLIVEYINCLLLNFYNAMILDNGQILLNQVRGNPGHPRFHEKKILPPPKM